MKDLTALALVWENFFPNGEREVFLADIVARRSFFDVKTILLLRRNSHTCKKFAELRLDKLIKNF